MMTGELNEQERYLYAHISDLSALSRKTGIPRFSAFLNEREAVIAAAAANNAKARPVFYGGYDGAVRTTCGFIEGTYAEELPCEELFGLNAVTFSFRKRDDLSHRDFLGAILALGVKRSAVGDILTADDFAVVFCLNSVSEPIMSMTKIGKAGVKTYLGIERYLPKPVFEKHETTVSSLRLDCFVGACVNVSRERSAAIIRSGRVNVDFSVCLKNDMTVKEGSVISIRGFGRYRLSDIAGETKKGRMRVVIEKYI